MSEKRFTIILMILAIVGFALYAYKYQYDNKILLGEDAKLITEIKSEDFYSKRALDYLTKNNISVPDQNILAVSVASDDAGYAFLQRTLGKEKMHDYIQKHKLTLSGHTVRIFQEYEKRELHVYLNSQTGTVYGFDEFLAEDAAIKSIDNEVDAEKSVLQFLEGQKVNLNSLEKISYNIDKKEKRVDHFFNYKIKSSVLNTEFGQGHIEYSVVISGDKIASFRKFIFIPENFGREINNILAIGDFLALLSMFISALMALLAIIICIQAFSEKRATWKIFSLIFVLLIIFSLFANLDSLKYFLSTYPTDENFNIFIWTTIISGLIYSIATPVIIFMSGVSGKYLDEKINHNQLSNSKYIETNVFKGYLIAMLSLGITAIIYFIGEKYLDVWTYGAPNPFVSSLYILPLLSAIYLGMSSSIGEEIIFRYFGFLFFKKHLKNVFLSMLIITIIWAVGHSNYPVFPVYFRGIELVIGGMIWAYFILRYNLLTTITAHYVYNVVLFATPLILTNSVFMITNGIFALIFPIIFIYIYKFTVNNWRHHVH